MYVGFAILLAAIVGGVMFMLIDRWERREPATVKAPEPVWSRPEPAWTPPAAPKPQPIWDRDDRDDQDKPGSLWSGWAQR